MANYLCTIIELMIPDVTLLIKKIPSTLIVDRAADDVGSSEITREE